MFLCGILYLVCNIGRAEAQISFTCQGNGTETSDSCFLRNKMYRIANNQCREKCAFVPSVANLFGWQCGTCSGKNSPPVISPTTAVTPIGNPIRAPSVAFPIQQPALPPTPTSTGNKKCGGAVNSGGSANATCLSDLWNPTQDRNMHCYAYGGLSDPCALHNNNDINDGLFKSPSKCDRDTFYLWDEVSDDCFGKINKA
jgi:hypothetical protein